MEKRIQEILNIEPYICARCGYCNTVCPTYNLNKDRWESVSPRGKIALLRQKILNKPKEIKRFTGKLFDCLLCGACEEVCQTKIPLLELWKLSRERVFAYAPDAALNVNKAVDEFHNPMGLDNQERTYWTKRLRNLSQNFIKEKADVVYFVGCSTAMLPMLNSIGVSFVRLLDRLDINFSILGNDEWCCGFPQILVGKAKEAEKQIRHNVEFVNRLGAKTLVTTCPGCYRVFKEEYKEILPDVINFEVMHATQLIDRFIKEGRIKFKDGPHQLVTYHDPCDLGRKSKIFDAPREIIRSIPGLELVEMINNRNESTCCGAGAVLAFINPELSGAVSRQKIAEIKATNAEVVFSACQSCKKNIKETANLLQEQFKVMDVTEIVMERLI